MALTDAQGRTPLHYAAAVNDSGDIYRILEELGSDVYKEDMVRMLQPYIYHQQPKQLSLSEWTHARVLLVEPRPTQTLRVARFCQRLSK